MKHCSKMSACSERASASSIVSASAGLWAGSAPLLMGSSAEREFGKSRRQRRSTPGARLSHTTATAQWPRRASPAFRFSRNFSESREAGTGHTQTPAHTPARRGLPEAAWNGWEARVTCRAPARPRKQDSHKWGFLPPAPGMGPSLRGSGCLRGSERREGDQLGLKPGESLGTISISVSLLGTQPPRQELPLEGSKCPEVDCWGPRPGSPGKAQPRTSSHRLGVSQCPQPSGGGQLHRFMRLSETGKTQWLGEFSVE